MKRKRISMARPWAAFPSAALVAASLFATRAIAQDDAAPKHAAPGPWAWNESLDDALALARLTERPALAYFSFDTCHWCRVLEEKTFPDPRIVKAAERFHWVYVDRDAHPELVKRFAVSAYPGLLVLGPDGENVWRWSGYDDVDGLLTEFAKADRRWQLLLDGEDFAAAPRRPRAIAEQALLAALPSPSADVPWGVTDVAGRRFVGRGSTLFELDRETHEVVARHDVGIYQDLTTDGERLWLLPSSWTKDGRIDVFGLDGAKQRTVTAPEPVDPRKTSARGIAFLGDRLFVLEIDGNLHELDPGDGRVIASRSLGRAWVYGLAAAGHRLVTASRTSLLWLDPDTGAVAAERPTNYHVRGLGWRDDRVLCQEQPVWGFDENHVRVPWYAESPVLHEVLWLPATARQPDAPIRIEVVRRAAHQGGEPVDQKPLHWTVDGWCVETVAGLEAIVAQRLRESPAAVRIAPQKGATYGDVADTVDAVAKAGAKDLEFAESLDSDKGGDRRK